MGYERLDARLARRLIERLDLLIHIAPRHCGPVTVIGQAHVQKTFVDHEVPGLESGAVVVSSSGQPTRPTSLEAN
jgi:hypothetical protein